MLTALDDYLPDLSWTHPNGGFYVWLTLPENLDSKSMLPRAVKELVAYTPGTAFYADGGGRTEDAALVLLSDSRTSFVRASGASPP